jgi:hypothetical protein
MKIKNLHAVNVTVDPNVTAGLPKRGRDVPWKRGI